MCLWPRAQRIASARVGAWRDRRCGQAARMGHNSFRTETPRKTSPSFATSVCRMRRFPSRHASFYTPFPKLCVICGVSRADMPHSARHSGNSVSYAAFRAGDMPLLTRHFSFCVSNAAFPEPICRIPHAIPEIACRKRRFVLSTRLFSHTISQAVCRKRRIPGRRGALAQSA